MEEHGLLKVELAFWATSLLTTVVSPMLAAAGTFATYVLISEENVLTAAQTFTVLLLFIALRFPISYFGRLIGRAAQAMEAIRRLEAFMDRPVRDVLSEDDATPGGSPQDLKEEVLSVENAAFRVGAMLEESSLKNEPSNMDISKSGLTSTLNFVTSGVNMSLKRAKGGQNTVDCKIGGLFLYACHFRVHTGFQQETVKIVDIITLSGYSDILQAVHYQSGVLFVETNPARLQ